MRTIIKTNLHYRFLVVVLAGVLLYFGITQARSMPIDVLPEFSPPYVEIQTEALGLSAEEVEQLIAVPLEQDLLNGVAWLDDIHSDSVAGLSSVTLIFEPGTDLYRARQMVAERLSQAAVGLPHVSKSPTMLQPTSATSRVMLVGLSSKTLSLIQMSVLARWTIAPRLMGVPGVSNVAIWGLRDRQLQVQVDPERLRAHNVSLQQVVETTGNALWVSTLSFVEASSPGNAGFIDTPQQRLGIQHILPIVSPEGLAQVPVEGSQVRLLDVGKVVEDHQPLIGDALSNNDTSLLLVIEKFPAASTLQVTQGIEDALTALKPGLGGIEIDSSIYRPATFIELALANLGWALMIGAVLVIVLLLVLQWNWRATLISIIAIPLSLSAALLVLGLRNATLNVIVLAGLLVAVGAIVDDAIVDVENIARRLREARAAASSRSPLEIVLDGALEMRHAALFATFILLVAVLPIFSFNGLAGAFFQPLGVSYILAILASMFVAIMVTPVLSAILLTGTSAAGRRPSPIMGWLERGYAALLARIVQRPRGAYVAIALLVLIGVSMSPFLGAAMLPTFKEPDILIRLNAAPGTSHPAMVRLVSQASRELQSITGVRGVGTHVGRAIFGDQIVGVNSAELWVNLDHSADYAETVAQINRTIDSYPGLERQVQTYLKQTSGPIIAAPGEPLTVRVFGENYTELRARAEELRQMLAGVPGVVDPFVKLPVEEPTIQIEVDLAAAQHYGIKPGDVRRTAATLLNGIQVGSLFEEQKIFDVVVWSTPVTRQSVGSIRDLLIDTPDGGHVRLGDVAKVSFLPVPSIIRHVDVSRYIDVAANVQGRDVDAVVNDVHQRIQQMRFPLEYHAEVLGEYAEQQDARNRLLGFVVVALVGMFLFLQAAFQSWRLAIVSFLVLPVTMVGGLVAAAAANSVLSTVALVGLLTVFGIAARNCIALIKHCQRIEEEGTGLGPALVLRGARERLAPILMTALATGVLFAPLAFMGDLQGLELVRPMALVILGGLVTATLVNVFVIPTLYLRFAVPRAVVEPTPAPMSEQPSVA